MKSIAMMVAAAYVLGSIPFAYLFVRLSGRGDVRRVGSGNVGATNALRAAGWKVAVAVLALDIGKGVAAVWMMTRLTADPVWHAAAGAAVVAGHCFPVWLKFAGGKGVATAGGVFIMLAPTAAALAAGVWGLVLALSRRVSVASMFAAVSYPVAMWLVANPGPRVLVWVSAVSVVVLWRHRSNLQRLVHGEEPPVGRR